MPLLHIRSLPFATPLDVPAVLAAITADFARDTRTSRAHVTATWDFVDAEHYAVAGLVALQQPADTHPVLVDLLAPDTATPEQVERMLRSAATAVASHAGVPADNVFVCFHAARSGTVLDGGDVVRW